MSRMTITIDEDLLNQARKALGAKSKADTIRKALAEAVRKKCLSEAVEHRGKVNLTLDQESLKAMRADQ